MREYVHNIDYTGLQKKLFSNPGTISADSYVKLSPFSHHPKFSGKPPTYFYLVSIIWMVKKNYFSF